jgi:hypothetical protein
MAESGEYKVLVCLSVRPVPLDRIEDRIHELKVAGWTCRIARFEERRAIIHMQPRSRESDVSGKEK